MPYDVKDISLAEQGKKQIELAEARMKGLLKIRRRFAEEKPLSGLRIGMALHITKETAVLVRTLHAGGASVAITGCNPLSTQDDVAAALAEEGFAVFGWKGETNREYYDNLNRVLETKPNITIDDGCDLVTEVHTKRKELLKNIIGGAEETTTGVIRLRAMEKDGALKYPIIAVNDSKTKHLMDNYIGTGQSTIDGILRATNILLAGKNFVVCGYGSCGKGVAMRAKGMGANVIVTEVDPFRAVQALMDGYRVMPMGKAAETGDIFVTVTGSKHVISLDDAKKMKDGAVLANAGHFNIEIDLDSLEKTAKKRNIRPFMDEYTLNGKRLYVLGEGRLVNLAAAEGHPSEIMSMSFMNQALAAEYIAKNHRNLEPKIYRLPDDIDSMVAKIQLEALGVEIDSLTPAQKKYLESWSEGT
ncbi:MAG: adenosylhomocysteinase [Candidatus Aenigmarchaeota archaeon]|nr:adenosylhomocysteinase [Candidatus Aenigmarchaeota archaeon]